ncbi:MAG: hypothetical protein D6B25_08925 [Desulfobulbaceae bacterium]|nr:MAG: hypothetical protein D6B25_08925 [Desulfobulbaceae bacterium]
MSDFKILPNVELIENGPVTKAFIKKNRAYLHDACDHVLHLPYGRTSDRSNYMLVLTEARGACSSKHALIAALAAELKLPIQLTIGIYPMNSLNTPGIEDVLDNSDYPFIPEAHCFLTYQGNHIDITRTVHDKPEPITEFFHIEHITPEQIGEYKVQLHQKFIRQWGGNHKFAELWALREACIQALSS